MVMDDHDQEGREPRAAGTDCRADSPAGGLDVRLAVVLLALTAGLTAGGVVAARWLFSPARTVDASDKDTQPPATAHLFRGWPKPDLVLLLSGQEHGYLQPCGCSRPQRGGLERRYNFLRSLKQRGWPVVPLDLGDVAQTSGPRELPNVQGLIKYRYSMDALRLMDYLAVGIGETEGALPLKEALDNYALNNPKPPVVCTNLQDKATNFPEEVHDSVVSSVPGGPKVAVVAFVGATAAGPMSKDPQVQFEKVRIALPGQLKKLAPEKPDLTVVLYQGSPGEARNLAAAYPQIDVILCQSEDDEGPGQPEQIGHTCLVKGVGHKGKNVGVLGVFKTGNGPGPYEFRYHLVPLGEEYLTPAGEEGGSPIAQLMERYTQELQKGGYLRKYGQGNHPLQVAVAGIVPTYVGSEKCKKCHEFAYDVWKNSAHTHAYQTLVDVKHPSLRQYDGECIVCHVTGFAYKSGFIDADTTPKLKDVGCEACHGPGSEHAKNPNNPKWHTLMNPWKAPAGETPAQKEIRLLAVDKACQRCHDPDNDVHWDYQQKWPKVAHPTPEG
jgi:hypothetical protein